MRNLIIAAVVVIVLSVLGLLAWTRLGLRERITQSPTDTTPLGPSPASTTLPFGTTTPFPLITFATPSATPIAGGRFSTTPSPSLSPSPTASPAPTLNASSKCLFLIAVPDEGTAPLTVKLSAIGTAVATGRTYEFDFGDGSDKVSGTAASTTHRYETAGNFAPTLVVKDSQGENINLVSGDCKTNVSAKAQPITAKGGVTQSLPKTGPEEAALFFIIPAILLGRYIYKKYKLV